MTVIDNLTQQFGLMTWPLLICSILTVMILVERFIQVLLCTGVGKTKVTALLDKQNRHDDRALDQLAEQLKHQRPLLCKGISMLISHRHFTKPLREDAASIWLLQKRQQLRSGLRLLSLIGVISPLLGLLGTVLGLIEMFKSIALSTGSVTPSDLADGLGLAMRTTAAGLIIALPAITGSQLLGLWADSIMATLDHSLNRCNLWLEGMNIDVGNSPVKPCDTCEENPAYNGKSA
ncbi:MotA/TolQ/ExbB proton channel family protein [Photobacterium carnosum]|uniref:MotA/TolQ/ExbB proton channel family protein n=1 Tax=Photobacterium carnosum TaxID=2023717 RepID=UPI001E464A61|nr:MotA/TolQ/ExbB proton channel family protein [Photobacterium carnosum]MCD9529454.1 MotA/TolQ/ExbB proton channel family protein [Photobacterium carnosum]MCF2153799.1 MotA/TolQ/ExbB proton channel family protein [Photobacterium carnosum]MCF2215559.1 MotA/TolQ/ExbB proton channel family protein [Photobacterium carnosum]